MKKAKKIVSLLLAVVMLFGMSATVLAAASDPNFTKSDSCEWSTPVTAGQSVTLKVGPADAGYNYTGYETEDEAKKQLPPEAWKVNYGGDHFTYTTGVASDVNHKGDSCYAGTITITPDQDYYGPISVHAAPIIQPSEWAYVDMTVYSEAPAADRIPDATGVEINVADVRRHEGTGWNITLEGATIVPVRNDVGTNPFKDVKAFAQSYPTAAVVLANMQTAGALTVDPEDGYIHSITRKDGTLFEPKTDKEGNPIGWNYCVIRDDVIVEVSSKISGSVLPIQSNDFVVCSLLIRNL